MYLIDEPSPWASTKELQEFLAEIDKLPDEPEVVQARERVLSLLKQRRRQQNGDGFDSPHQLSVATGSRILRGVVVKPLYLGCALVLAGLIELAVLWPRYQIAPASVSIGNSTQNGVYILDRVSGVVTFCVETIGSVEWRVAAIGGFESTRKPSHICAAVR